MGCFISILLQGCAVARWSGVWESDTGGAGSQCYHPRVTLPSGAPEQRASIYMPSEPREVLPEPELTLTPEVKRQLNEFGRSDGLFITRALCARGKYYPQMAQIFHDEGLPLTLLNLALIESGFNESARSGSGAVGIWQFMKSTGKIYGLQIGLFVDERKDPILSTIAAARHLKDLYKIYKDWHLVLAAYNAGPGAVNRALMRSKSTSFWEIARSGKLPRQTTEFVPRFIAASLLMQNREMSDRAVAQETLLPQKETLSEPTSDSSRTGNRRTSAG